MWAAVMSKDWEAGGSSNEHRVCSQPCLSESLGTGGKGRRTSCAWRILPTCLSFYLTPKGQMGVPLNTEVLFPLHENLVCTICQALLERFGIIGGKLILKKVEDKEDRRKQRLWLKNRKLEEKSTPPSCVLEYRKQNARNWACSHIRNSKCLGQVDQLQSW